MTQLRNRTEIQAMTAELVWRLCFGAASSAMKMVSWPTSGREELEMKEAAN
jgi:hypothetical protein